MSAAAEAGRANDAVLALLAETLEVPRRDLELTSGQSSRDKVVALDGMTSQIAETLLAAAAEKR